MTPRRVMVGIVGALLALGRVHAMAAGPESGRREEEAFAEDLPVVLTVSRMPQPLAEAPGAVTVLDRELIRASGARSIPDLLRLVPGVYVGFKNGHSPAVSYHGIADDYPRRMQVLIDGRSVFTPYFVGGVDWSSWPIALDDIESIEVVRGTNSVAYGSNAFLGVVNIITRTAIEGRGARVSIGQGGKGIQDRTVRVGIAHETVAARLTYGLRKDNGFDALNDSSRTEFVNARVDWRPGSRTEASLWAGGSVGRRGDGFATFLGPDGMPSAVPNTFYPEHDRFANSGFGHLRLRHSFSPDNELIVQAYQNRESGEDRWVGRYAPRLPSQPLNADRLAQRDSFDVQHVFRPLAALRLSLGGEWRRDTLRSAFSMGTTTPQSAYLGRLYVNGEWRLAPKWIVNAGVMRERYSLSGTDVAPRAFVNWQPSREHALRAGYSEGYRTPTLFEERSNWTLSAPGVPVPIDRFYRSSGGLSAERVRSYEIGYVGDLRIWRATVDLRLFQESVDRYICRIVRPLAPGSELTADQGVYDFANCSGSQRVRGAEIGIRARPFDGTLLVANYGALGIDDRFALSTPPGTTSSGDPRDPGSSRTPVWIAPRVTRSLLVKQALPHGFELSAAVYWSPTARGAPSQLAGSFQSTLEPPAYRRIDARIAKRLRVAGLSGEWALVGQNLGRGSDDLLAGSPFTRRYFATVAIDF